MDFKFLENYVNNNYDKNLNFQDYMKDPDKFCKDTIDKMIKTSDERNNFTSKTDFIKKLKTGRQVEVNGIDDLKHNITFNSELETKKAVEIQHLLIKEVVKTVMRGDLFIQTERQDFVDLCFDAQKHKFQDELDKLNGSEKETYIKARKEALGKDRDILNLLKPNPYSKVDGPETFNQLKNATSEIERSKIFEDFLNKKIDETQNMNLNYKDDIDLAKNYDKVFTTSMFFSPDMAVFTTLERDLGIKISQATINRYAKMKGPFQDQLNYIQGDAKIIMDEAYPIFTRNSIDELENAMNDDMVPYYKDTPTLQAGLYRKKQRGLDPKESVFDFYNLKYKFDGNTKFIGKDGIIDINEAKKLLNNAERVVLVNDKNEPIPLQSDKHGFPTPPEDLEKPITFDGKNIDPRLKETLSESLKVMNSGTSMFIRSSGEYKKMRGILSDLATNKNPSKDEVIEKLSQFKELGKTYLQNHDKKTTISETAMKRKGCVLDALEKVNSIFEAVKVDEQTIQQNLENSLSKESTELDMDLAEQLKNDTELFKKDNIEPAQETTIEEPVNDLSL